MKILNKNKIIVSALGLAIGASLAGSISGTVAWYQYSTRANVSFLGEASGISGNLQMRFASESTNESAWRTRITKEELANNIVGGTKLVPMTFGGLGIKEDLPAKGYTQPVAGVKAMSSWVEAVPANYAQFTLQLRYVARDGDKEGGNKDDKNIAKKVYLSNMVLKEDHNNGEKGDISEAVRVHVSSSYNDGSAQKENRLISKSGGSTVTHGVLDLDADGKIDQEFPDGDEFGFEHTDQDLVNIDYGDNKTQKTLAAASQEQEHTYYDNADAAQTETAYPALVGTSSNSLVLTNTEKMTIGTEEVEKYIGKTMENESEYLTVTVTVWVEGWHRFDYSARTGSPKFDAIWDTDLIGAKFDLGVQFAVQDASVQEA